MKKYLGFATVSVFLLSCADYNTERDNPYDERAYNYIGNSSGVRPSSSVKTGEPSSSSVVPSSSSYGDLCIGFVEGTQREHHGKMKEQFCDERDGNKYVYVKINNQTWMAENLNYATSGSICYMGSVNCETYGKLYGWATAMSNSASSTATPSGVRGVCPAGWHIPSDAEWDELVTFAGGNNVAGTELKATQSGNKNGNGTDDYGFSALLGGTYCTGTSVCGFFQVGDRGYWWSATESGSSNAYGRYMGYNYSYVGRSNENKSYLYSVRCLQD